MSNTAQHKLPYRLERLPVIYPYHRRSENNVTVGDLVYYGPTPVFYGIGEVLNIIEQWCVVDFRGTGELKIHKDAFESKYLIPIHKMKLEHLVIER